MTDYKKLIIGLGYQGGKAFTWDGKRSYGEGLAELSRLCSDNGADQVLVYDRSTEDDGHEAAIAAIKEASRTMVAPIIAGGRVKRLEDVKKYLYAGASAVFLDVSRQENVDMMKEAADRFGNEKIYAYLPDMSYLKQAEEYSQLGASMLILCPPGSVPTLAELGEIGECSLPCLVLGKEKEEARELTEELKLVFGCQQVKGAILTLQEASMDKAMEMKQQLKAAGVSVDTFESSVAWKDFKLNSDGLIPVIVQDYKTNEVLMMAYMNEEAFEATLASGRMTYYSRSRQKLWLKGETSGHFQYVKSLKIDCDNDTILATVKQIGAACHTGNRSCFFTTLAEKDYKETNPLKVFEDEYQIIVDRKAHPKEGSYTNYLFDKGIDKILKKLGEEATEIIIAAKNPDPEEIKYEISDFLYHMMVLMVEKGVTWEEITEEVANR